MMNTSLIVDSMLAAPVFQPVPLPPRPQRARARVLFWSIISAIVGAGLGGGAMVALFLWLLSTPQVLSAEISLPRSADVGEAFPARLEIRNPHKEAVQLSDLTFPEGFLENFTVVSFDPPPAHASRDGTLTYFYNQKIRPGRTQTIHLGIVPRRTGVLAFEMDVCTRLINCSSFATTIEVNDKDERPCTN